MYYASREKDGMGGELILIRQDRFRKEFKAGRPHPHDIMLYGRSVEDAKKTAKKHLRFPVDWSGVEEGAE